MIAQWRLFLTALHFFTRISVSGPAHADIARPSSAARFVPLIGVLVGALGGGVYWIAAQLWPTNVAVILSMLTTAQITGRIRDDAFAFRERQTPETSADAHAAGMAAMSLVFVLFIKYNALMALSAAYLGFPLPANIALGLIMICGHAASRALVVSVIATRTQNSAASVSNGDLGLALGLGFAPALLLGIPGLVGLVAAIVMRIGFASYIKRKIESAPGGTLDTAQQLTEISFYLGALATWTYA